MHADIVLGVVTVVMATLGVVVSLTRPDSLHAPGKWRVKIFYATAFAVCAVIAIICVIMQSKETTAARQNLTNALANLTASTREITRVTGLNTQLQEKLLDQDSHISEMAKENLENITGGKAFAYLVPEFVPNATGSSINLYNDGNEVLTGITVKVGRVTGNRDKPENYWLQRKIDSIQMGSLGPHQHALMPDYWLTPRENGILTTHFVAIISAQNGDVIEDIFVRHSKSVNGFAWRFTVKKTTGNGRYKTLKIVDWTEPKPL